MYRVSLIGHSNVPRDGIEAFGCEVRVYRSLGARAALFGENPVLQPVLGWQHELAILFLGSNDITPEVEAYEITDNIKAIVRQLEQCATKVALVLIEPRKIVNPPPGKVDQGTYDRVSRSVNRKLQRDLRGCEFLRYDAPYYKNHLKPDGVHWNREGKWKVKRDLIRYLNRKFDEDWRSWRVINHNN